MSSVVRLFAQKRQPKPVGRPPILSRAHQDKLEQTLTALVDKAQGRYEVTAAMVKRKARVNASVRAVSDALHSRGIYFRKMREKPILRPEHVKARYDWAKKHKGKSAQWWLRAIHVHLDNHHFQVATTHTGRCLLSRRRVRGVYRKREKSLRPLVVKPSSKLRQNTGARGVLIAGGVGLGKALVWHVVEGAWGGVAAECLYMRVVRPKLETIYPGKRSFSVLEDNDPTGNMSKKGMEAKRSTGLKVFSIPEYSPDLNVMDYVVWAEVEKRMRRQERAWPENKKETRDAFIRRLARTARGLSEDFMDKSIKDLRRRCALLYEAKGGLFEEGGRKPRVA